MKTVSIILLVVLVLGANVSKVSFDKPFDHSALGLSRSIRPLNVARPDVVNEGRDPENPYVVHCLADSDIDGDGQDDFCTRSLRP